VTRAHGVGLRSWLAWWRLRRKYHRYRVTGMENLARERAQLIVGYHGRPIAYDLCILTVNIYEELGYLPHGIVHAAIRNLPGGSRLVDQLGFVTGDDGSIQEVVNRGEHLVVTPGGTREATRSVRHRYRVDWGERHGYLRLARRYGLEIVPVGSAGVDDGYIGLNNGYRWGKRARMPSRLPLWVGIGLGGVWPVAPPLPVRFSQVIGAPLDVSSSPFGDEEQDLHFHHQRVTRAVQQTLDVARRGHRQ